VEPHGKRRSSHPSHLLPTMLLGTGFAYGLAWLLNQLDFPWELFAEVIWW
jgi:hypothetical protein